MKRRRQLPGGLSVSVPERTWQLMLLLAGGAERERTTTALARRSGVSPAHVRELLADVEGVAVCRDGHDGWALVRAYGLALEDRAFAQSELQATTRRLHQAGRTAPNKGQAATAALEDAEAALAAFDIAAATRIIRTSRLSARELLPLVAPKDRGLVRGRLARLRVDVFMQAGDGLEAAAEAARVLKDPEGLLPEHIVRLHMNRGAALSFEHLGAADAALASYDAAIAAAQHLPFGDYEARYFLRWAYTARATPLTATGRFEDARTSLGRAEELLNPSQPDLVDARSEVLLYQARLAAAEARGIQSADLVATVEKLLPGTARWIWGWFPRYAADAAVGALIRNGTVTGEPERREATRLLLDAWVLADGFGYQRRVIALRLAHLRADPEDEDHAEHPAWKGVQLLVAAKHRERHGRRPSECSCHEGGFSARVYHALDW